MIDFLKRRFFRHTIIYLCFAFLNKGLSFLLVPLFTRYLTPEDYGIYALFLTAVMICEPFISFCVVDAIGNVYFAPARFDIRDYVSTLMFLCIGMLTLQILLIGGLVLFPLKKFEVSSFFLFAPLVAFSNIMIGALGWMWQLKEKPVPYGRFNLYYMSSQLFLQVLVTVFWKMGWRGVLCAQGILALITIVLALIILRKNNWLGFCFSKNCLRYGLKFGLGYIPNVLSMRLNDSIGRLCVSQRYNLSETGIYSAGQKLGGILNVFNQSFINVYRPWLFKKLAGDDRKGKRKIILSVGFACASVAVFALGGSLCMYIFSGFILGQNFVKSQAYVLWSVLANAIHGMNTIVSFFIYQTGKSWLMSLITITVITLNALLTWYFIGVFGMIGAAYAPVLAWALTLTLSIFASVTLWKNRPPFGNAE